MSAAARVLTEAAQADGPLWVLAGADLSNEEAFAVARLASEVLHTPHRDSPARAMDAAAVWHVQYVMSAPYRVPPLSGLASSDAVIALNSNLASEHPQAYAWMVRAQKAGAAIILFDEIDQGLGRIADVHVAFKPGALGAALEMLLQVLTGFEPTAARGQLHPADIGTDEQALKQAAALVSGAQRPCLVASANALPYPQAAAKMAEIVLWLRTGSAEAAELYLLRSECNTLGLELMGLKPEDEQALDIYELAEGKVKLAGILVVGDDLARWIGQEQFDKIRANLGSMVVLASFDSPTVQAADVVLPIAAAGEREGTFVGQDGRVWWSEAIVEPPGESRGVLQVVGDLAVEMGGTPVGATVDEVWGKILDQVMECRRVELEAVRLGETQMVHTGVLAQPTGSPEPVEVPVARGEGEGREWTLIVRRDENSWAFDPRVRAMAIVERDMRRVREPYVYLNPEDIEALGTREGRHVEISTGNGSARATVRGLSGVPVGVIVLPEQFADVRVEVMGAGDATVPWGRRWPPVRAALRAGE